jgi:signal transduction histidine kinase
MLAIPTTDLHAALNQAVHLVSKVLGADSACVYLYDPASNSLVAVAASHTLVGNRQHQRGLERLLLADDGRLVQVFQTGKMYMAPDLAQDPIPYARVRQPLDLKSAVAVPLEASGVRRGLVCVASRKADRFADQYLPFLEAVSHWAGMAIERAELMEQHTAAKLEHERLSSAEEMMTVLAHDLRNYLTTIQGRADFLRRRSEREGREQDTHDAQIVSQVVARLQHLIENLLDVTRIEQSIFTLSKQTFDLATMVHTCADLLRTPATDITVEGPSELVIVGDPDRVQQAIENIVNNAIRHGATGTLVAVGLDTTEQQGRRLAVITVRDYGPGIPSELRANLFKRFAHGPQSTGLGLGLYLARGIAEAHGGAVTVDSMPDQGTIVCMTLAVS